MAHGGRGGGVGITQPLVYLSKWQTGPGRGRGPRCRAPLPTVNRHKELGDGGSEGLGPGWAGEQEEHNLAVRLSATICILHNIIYLYFCFLVRVTDYCFEGLLLILLNSHRHSYSLIRFLQSVTRLLFLFLSPFPEFVPDFLRPRAVIASWAPTAFQKFYAYFLSLSA